MLPDKLKIHPFTIAALEKAVALEKKIEGKEGGVESEDIDEYHFYIVRVGYSLAQLLTWMEQIDHAVYYLSDFSYSAMAKRKGINRARHLLYNVENYLIRLQSVYDRSLQLTNNVFHLCIEESNVSHSAIVSNLQVSRTKVAGLLKSLRRAIEPKAQERHQIIHRNSYQDPELRRLELFYMFDEESWGSTSDSYSFEGLSHVRTQLMKKVIAKRRREFSALNQLILERVEALLSELHGQYNKECARLKLYVYR